MENQMQGTSAGYTRGEEDAASFTSSLGSALPGV